MSRYGILGRYLPAYGQIVGQMQHDLFHSYTVDAHTLLVIENMRRFLLPENDERFPVTSRVARRLPKIELLYLAGLFHDIGKGRGGDHSELGAVDAREFCEEHGLSRRDTNLVEWLVRNHLLMSAVAQRKDISDPDVCSSSPATSATRTASTTSLP
jgi:[protein-PII] uridylyltransferase